MAKASYQEDIKSVYLHRMSQCTAAVPHVRDKGACLGMARDWSVSSHYKRHQLHITADS